MSRKYDEALPLEALAVASQAVLVELIKRLASISPAHQHVAINTLVSVNADLQSLAREHSDSGQERVLAQAASIVQDMHRVAFGASEAERGGSEQ